MGRPTDQMNNSMIPIIFGHFADQMSTYQVFFSVGCIFISLFHFFCFFQAIHFGQLISSGKFQKFDHGKAENIERYGQAQPPNYNLQNARAPVAAYYAESDWQSVPKDVRKLISELPNVVYDYLIPHKAFNHGDFAYGKDARRLVYDEVLKMIKSTEV